MIGVVSGAGAWKPALVLDRKQTDGRQRVALVGKAYCLADADVHPIGAGDLLPTSDTVGHAMKATDAARAFGATLGKALRPLEEGRGLLPVLILLA